MQQSHSESTSRWRTPMMLLVLMSVAMPIAFNAWSALLNNFVVERAAFTGVEIGILQSLREVRGFWFLLRFLCFWFCVNKPLLCSPWRCWVWALQLLDSFL